MILSLLGRFLPRTKITSMGISISLAGLFAGAQDLNIADVIFQFESEIKYVDCRFLSCSALKLY